MNGRNFLDLALLVPGVSPTNVGSTQLFRGDVGRARPGSSVGSQRNFSNNFIVDGLSANDDAAGLSGIPYGVDAVDQFQVVTSGGQAELGRALGGYVNVVTKSGTNALHGDLYGYLRDDRFNARERAVGTKLPMDQQQYGGSLGGPIVRDRTFFFSNFEQRKLDQSGLVDDLAGRTSPSINARLAAVGYPGLAGHDRHLSESRGQYQLSRQARSPGQRQRSARRSLQPLRRYFENARGAGALTRRRRRRGWTTSIRRSRSAIP